MSVNPSSRWFWNDWENDLALKLCSFAAQGLWMRMLCIAAKADPPGFVTVNGKTVGATELALLTGRSEAEILPLLRELEGASVFSRDRHGRIYNRRMVRDTRIADRNRKNGAKGGNPTLIKGTENKEEFGVGITPRLTSKSKKVIPPIPYTQDSSLRSESGVADATPAKVPSDREIAERMAASWREMLAGSGLPMPSKLNRKRIVAAAARWRDELGREEAQWRAFLGRIRGSPFLLGGGARGWKATFDWALEPGSILETLEGKYAPRSAANGHAAGAEPDPAWTEEDQWRARLDLWRRRGSWRPATWGPEPGKPGCCVPPHLLAAGSEERKGER